IPEISERVSGRGPSFFVVPCSFDLLLAVPPCAYEPFQGRHAVAKFRGRIVVASYVLQHTFEAPRVEVVDDDFVGPLVNERNDTWKLQVTFRAEACVLTSNAHVELMGNDDDGILMQVIDAKQTSIPFGLSAFSIVLCRKDSDLARTQG